MPQPLVTENAKHIVDKEGNKVYPTFYQELLYVETKISSSDLKELKEIARKILDNSDTLKGINHTLAGNIEKEFTLDESFEKILEPYACSLTDYYIEQQVTRFVEGRNELDKDLVSFYSFRDVWINFQKKYEFNPIHGHSGDFSFVLWIQIPYDLEEELSLPNCVKANGRCNSLFKFITTNTAGKIIDHPLMIDKSWEGVMVLFPANQKHQVYPFFTSDDYRISISGNLIIKPKSKKTFSYQ